MAIISAIHGSASSRPRPMSGGTSSALWLPRVLRVATESAAEPVPMAKRQKADKVPVAQIDGSAASTSGRTYTVSLAVPASVVESAKSLEWATAIAGQIARSAAVFCVDEVRHAHALGREGDAAAAHPAHTTSRAAAVHMLLG